MIIIIVKLALRGQVMCTHMYAACGACGYVFLVKLTQILVNSPVLVKLVPAINGSLKVQQQFCFT